LTRLYISADLEGACGVTSFRQCAATGDRPAYDRACDQLAREVSAVVEAALEAGATHIRVNDAHSLMTNLHLNHLPPWVELVSGKPKISAMTAGLDASYDAAMFIGYHARAGTHQGVLNHTFHSRLFDVKINGQAYGEGGINAFYASLGFGVPLIMASGDEAFRAEIHTLLPNLPVVVTKTGIGCYSAINRPLDAVLDDYATLTKQALHAGPNAWKANLLKLDAPYTLEVTLLDTLAADIAATLPWLERGDGRTVKTRCDDMITTVRALQSVFTILAYAAHLE
jgi:D-amino peptidase